MKNYPTPIEIERIQKMQQRLDELRLFQSLLRENPELSNRFHNKASEIADGLQPWIEALEMLT